MDAHKQARLKAYLELLECHAGYETFLKRIMTGDETWVHHYEPESKRASTEWRHSNSPRAKKFSWKSYYNCVSGH